MVPNASPLAREDRKAILEAAPGSFDHFSLGSQRSLVNGVRGGSSRNPGLTQLVSLTCTSDHPSMPLPLHPAPLPSHRGLHLGKKPK